MAPTTALVQPKKGTLLFPHEWPDPLCMCLTEPSYICFVSIIHNLRNNAEPDFGCGGTQRCLSAMVGEDRMKRESVVPWRLPGLALALLLHGLLGFAQYPPVLQ